MCDVCGRALGLLAGDKQSACTPIYTDKRSKFDFNKPKFQDSQPHLLSDPRESTSFLITFRYMADGSRRGVSSLEAVSPGLLRIEAINRGLVFVISRSLFCLR